MPEKISICLNGGRDSLPHRRFRGARLSSLPTEKWALVKTPAWEARAVRIRWVMMTFSIVRARKGWRKTENPEGTAQADFVTIIIQAYFDTL